MKSEMAQLQQNAVQNHTATMLEIGTSLLSQTAEQTRKLTDVETQVSSHNSFHQNIDYGKITSIPFSWIILFVTEVAKKVISLTVSYIYILLYRKVVKFWLKQKLFERLLKISNVRVFIYLFSV